jgi:hypothetical protein
VVTPLQPRVEIVAIVESEAVKNKRLVTKYCQGFDNLQPTKDDFQLFIDFVEGITVQKPSLKYKYQKGLWTYLGGLFVKEFVPNEFDNLIEGVLYQFLKWMYYRQNGSINRSFEITVCPFYTIYCLKGKVREIFIEHLKTHSCDGFYDYRMKESLTVLIKDLQEAEMYDDFVQQFTNILENGPWELSKV